MTFREIIEDDEHGGSTTYRVRRSARESPTATLTVSTFERITDVLSASRQAFMTRRLIDISLA
jgi:hypothetical protein